MKKYTNPANEPLPHACGQTDIHLPPPDKRYSPITSTICGSNKTLFRQYKLTKSTISDSTENVKPQLIQPNAPVVETFGPRYLEWKVENKKGNVGTLT